MLQTLIDLVRRDGATYILDSSDVSYRDISCTEVSYVKDGRYFVATAYHTTTWIAPFITGPLDSDHKVLLDKLEQVAEIREYRSFASVTNRIHPTEHSLEKIYNIIQKMASEWVAVKFIDLKEMQYSIEFVFIPFPSIIVTLKQNAIFIGSCAIDMMGNIELVSYTSEEIRDKILSMQTKCFGPVTEVFF